MNCCLAVTLLADTPLDEGKCQGLETNRCQLLRLHESPLMLCREDLCMTAASGWPAVSYIRMSHLLHEQVQIVRLHMEQ